MKRFIRILERICVITISRLFSFILFDKYKEKQKQKKKKKEISALDE